MLTIGIELNNVVRNVNKQILKYYKRDVDDSIDLDEIDDKSDIFKGCVKFKSKKDKYNFIYIDYPYEIFGCANAMEKDLPTKITLWLEAISNIREDDVRIIFFSLDEDNLTIQSTYFFLSKTGSRVRKVIFPKDDLEVWNECDAIITTKTDFFDEGVPEGKKVVLINREYNSDYKDKAFLNYNSLSDIIDDKHFFQNFFNEKI